MRDPSEIVRRKEQLIARCEAQRGHLADVFRELERPIAVADRALRVVRYLRAHPLLVGGAVAAAVALRRRSTAGLVARALAGWRLWRGISAMAGSMGAMLARRRRRGSAGDLAS
jgi:hypothetical protein